MPPPELRLLLATRNKGKIREIQFALQSVSIEFQSLLDWSHLPEAPETGSSFVENACLKAQHYYALARVPCLADDSGLAVDALQGAPGIQSARFALIDEQRIEKLLNMLRSVAAPDRTARFICALCLYMGHRTIEVVGEVEGQIALEPKGTRGFGYDPVFFYPPLGKTFAEMTLEEKNKISHRARALKKLQTALGISDPQRPIGGAREA